MQNQRQREKGNRQRGGGEFDEDGVQWETTTLIPEDISSDFIHETDVQLEFLTGVHANPSTLTISNFGEISPPSPFREVILSPIPSKNNECDDIEDSELYE